MSTLPVHAQPNERLTALFADWTAAPDRHPLVGVVLDTVAAQVTGQGAGILLAHAKSWPADAIVLLGETHDNAEHHKLRALVIEILAAGRDSKPALVFEHIRADQAAGLDAFATFDQTARRPATASDLVRLLKWDESGWPESRIFQPLFSTAIRYRLPILAGDPARDMVRRVAREGLAALPPGERTRLGLDTALDPASLDALLGELEGSHCGLMPKTAFATMADAQRYRDAHLAAELAAAAGRYGSAILLAGNGHVRRDRGVPHSLGGLAPGRRIVTVMLVEIEDGRTDATAYVPRDSVGGPAVDLIVFTPRAVRKDPCDDMRERFGKAKKG